MEFEDIIKLSNFLTKERRILPYSFCGHIAVSFNTANFFPVDDRNRYNFMGETKRADISIDNTGENNESGYNTVTVVHHLLKTIPNTYDKDELAKDYLEKSIDYFNNLITCIKCSSYYPNLHRITYKDLKGDIKVILCNRKKVSKEKSECFFFKNPVIAPKNEKFLTYDKQQNAQRLLDNIAEEPFFESVKLLQEGQYLIYQENYSAGIVLVCAFVEQFIYITAEMLCTHFENNSSKEWGSNKNFKNPFEIEKNRKYKSFPISRLVNDILKPILKPFNFEMNAGGKEKKASGSKEFVAFWENAVRRRNEFVHQNEFIGREESLKGEECVIKFIAAYVTVLKNTPIKDKVLFDIYRYGVTKK